MAITHNFLYRSWLLIRPYEKEEANIVNNRADEKYLDKPEQIKAPGIRI